MSKFRKFVEKIFGKSPQSEFNETLFAASAEDTKELLQSYSTGNKTEAAKVALLTLPSCLSAFNAKPIEDANLDICVRFSVSCKACCSDEFQILCHPLVLSPKDSDFDADDDGVLEQCPHHLVCAKCGKRELLFDSSRHGYDGALGHWNQSDPEEEERPIDVAPRQYRVHVIFTYNNDLDEMREISEETGIPTQDLFDWFHVIAVSDSGEELKDINYECA